MAECDNTEFLKGSLEIWGLKPKRSGTGRKGSRRNSRRSHVGGGWFTTALASAIGSIACALGWALVGQAAGPVASAAVAAAPAAAAAVTGPAAAAAAAVRQRASEAASAVTGATLAVAPLRMLAPIVAARKRRASVVTAAAIERERIIAGIFTDEELANALKTYDNNTEGAKRKLITSIKTLLLGAGIFDIMSDTSQITRVIIRILEYCTSIMVSPDQIMRGVGAAAGNVGSITWAAAPLLAATATAVSVGWAAQNTGNLIEWAMGRVNNDIQKLTEEQVDDFANRVVDEFANSVADAIVTNVPAIGKSITTAAKQVGSAAVAMTQKRAPAAPAAPAAPHRIATREDVKRLSAMASDAAASLSAAPPAKIIALLSAPSEEVLDASIGSGGDAAAIASLAANIGNRTKFVAPSKPVSGQKRRRPDDGEEGKGDSDDDSDGAASGSSAAAADAAGPVTAAAADGAASGSSAAAADGAASGSSAASTPTGKGRRTRRLRRRANRKRAFTRRH